MFDIDVVSDPVSNFSVDGWISNDAYSRLTAFDESLVKPALVLADRVNLYTMRVDFDRTTAAAAFENKNMPMRFLHAFASVCRAGDPELLETLGLDQKFLPTADELALFSSSTPGDKQWWKAVGKFEKKYSGPILDYRTSFHRILRQRHEDLESPSLAAAASAGVLTVHAWNADEIEPFHLTWNELADEYFEDAIAQMASRLQEGTNPLSIDPVAQATIRPSTSKIPLSETTMHVSMVLADRLPGLSTLSVPELLDLRSANAAYLAPFRAALLEIAGDVSGAEGSSPQELERLTKLAWERDVEPALLELEFQVERAGFGKRLLATVVDDKGSAIAAGASLAMGFGSLVAGLASLIPAALAAVYPVARALKERADDRRLTKTNRMYFLYRASAAADARAKQT